MVRPMVG